MDDPKDQLNFQSAPTMPDAGIYRTPLGKGTKDQTLPSVSSRILNAPAAQAAYASFGLEGLKSILLQELVRLEWEQLQDEMAYLAEGANQHKEIKRALRATKLLAAQWMDDPRQADEIKQKCEFIFSVISTFGTITIEAPDTAASQMGGVEIQFPTVGPLDPVGAEVEHQIAPGSALLFITDIQGHYQRLEQMLLNTQMAQIKGDRLQWTAPENLYLVVVGDLFNKSPYSTWGDGVGWDSYTIFKTLERLNKIVPNQILMAYGSHDLDLAIGAAFDHPLSGFLGETLGVNAQAQSIATVISFIKGTADPNLSDCAWEYDPMTDACTLKAAYQSEGLPYLSVPANDRAPNIEPLVQFYEKLYRALVQAQVQQRPQTIQDIDALAAGFMPAATEQLNLQNLSTSLGRCLHYRGLLEGSGALSFLRTRVAGLHIFRAGDLELFAMHPEIQEISLDMLLALKPRGEEAWQAPPLESFLTQSRVLTQRRLDPKAVFALLHNLRITQLNDWLGLSEEAFYQRLVKAKQLQHWVPSIVTRRDQKGFVDAYRQLRWELINEDPTGLAGYAINMDGIARRGEPLMRKMANLDERTRRSYTKTFLMDLLREEAQVNTQIEGDGIIVTYPHPETGQPLLTISLLIDESVAIYRDPKDNLHMPVKHAAWIEYAG